MFTALLVAFSFLGGAPSQSAPLPSKQQSAQPASTKMEAFQAKYGTVIIKGYSSIGTLADEFGGQIEVDCNEFSDASLKGTPPVKLLVITALLTLQLIAFADTRNP